MKAKTFIAKSLLLALVACSSTPSKSELDAEVRRLCAIDGGIKVYETVMLSADKFDSHGNVRAPSRDRMQSDDEYFREWSVTYIRKGNPELSRDHFKIFRRSDGKLLGEAIYYGRGGGDLPGPWHESSFRCPDISKKKGLESFIFIHQELQ
ncbi:hypothetical protein [Denitratisoma sp. DHT3]|uniref:hypothetical protein n=1 Tax=Denitratisoma sp. DHT3 TaxID=1981880 RepID=UPI0011A7A3E7|nr:hypothetical protein [Denitratisoma sp. DHT3]